MPHPSGRTEKTSLTTLELRRQIAERVDVLKNITDVANGKMPEQWFKTMLEQLRESGAFDEDEVDFATILRKHLTLNVSQILEANYALLKRILPELKQVDVTENNMDGQITPEDAAAVIAERVNKSIKALITQRQLERDKQLADAAEQS